MLKKIQRWYWRTLPYDWRPGQLWYRLICWVWHRYTTVKPRYLDHTWCDRCTSLPHTMFEILSEFVEKECSPGNIEWYGEYGHVITVNGTEKFVRDEIQDLYNWWHKVWNQEYGQVSDMLWKEAEKHSPVSEWLPTKDSDLYEYNPQFASEPDAKIYRLLLNALRELEIRMEKESQLYLHRLVNVIPYLWT